jgi:uncharacterized protein (DUF983 family)
VSVNACHSNLTLAVVNAHAAVLVIVIVRAAFKELATKIVTFVVFASPWRRFFIWFELAVVLCALK